MRCGGAGYAICTGARWRGDRFARRIDRDWRRISDSGNHGAERRGAARSGDDEPNADCRLRECDQREDATAIAGARFEFSSDWFYGEAGSPRDDSAWGAARDPG